ncbi:hypothetical protein COO91_05658 [Nostoc flagelliforme CCNUN1]|uniref:Uncharacterized protein n=1 Tax=Nostoc flagelliforme CCNUN1 TaxID=2038116 RepID=A0A2K8SWD0_9NOSO|nr:hypothetical protein COO91_05658 [Nostoc flagelliforme CCNUN1]
MDISPNAPFYIRRSANKKYQAVVDSIGRKNLDIFLLALKLFKFAKS